MFSIVKDLSTVKNAQYCGSYQVLCALQSVLWRVFSTVRRCHQYCGGYSVIFTKTSGGKKSNIKVPSMSFWLIEASIRVSWFESYSRHFHTHNLFRIRMDFWNHLFVFRSNWWYLQSEPVWKWWEMFARTRWETLHLPMQDWIHREQMRM